MENKGIYITIGLIAVLVFAVIVIIILSDGRDKKADNQANTTNTTNKINYEEAAEKQMAKPEKGETIAVMHVKNFGDITFKFFEDKAPKAVENFLTHAKEGYYNGVKFHRVIEEFMIQGGDPKGDGTGGESIWGTGFEEEFDDSLVPYRGALYMAILLVILSLPRIFIMLNRSGDFKRPVIITRMASQISPTCPL